MCYSARSRSFLGHCKLAGTVSRSVQPHTIFFFIVIGVVIAEFWIPAVLARCGVAEHESFGVLPASTSRFRMYWWRDMAGVGGEWRRWGGTEKVEGCFRCSVANGVDTS